MNTFKGKKNILLTEGEKLEDYAIQEDDDDIQENSDTTKRFRSNSRWLVSTIHKWQKIIHKSNRTQRRVSSLEIDKPLIAQLIKKADQEKTNREIWVHSNTTNLKNKIKEPSLEMNSINVRLINVLNSFDIFSADGEILKSKKDGYNINDKIKIFLPWAMSDDMGLVDNIELQFIWPWKMLKIDGRMYILNPFWINVIKRPSVKSKDSNKITIFKFQCPCRESSNAINSYDCLTAK